MGTAWHVMCLMNLLSAKRQMSEIPQENSQRKATEEVGKEGREKI